LGKEGLFRRGGATEVEKKSTDLVAVWRRKGEENLGCEPSKIGQSGNDL